MLVKTGVRFSRKAALEIKIKNEVVHTGDYQHDEKKEKAGDNLLFIGVYIKSLPLSVTKSRRSVTKSTFCEERSLVTKSVGILSNRFV